MPASAALTRKCCPSAWGEHTQEGPGRAKKRAARHCAARVACPLLPPGVILAVRPGGGATSRKKRAVFVQPCCYALPSRTMLHLGVTGACVFHPRRAALFFALPGIERPAFVFLWTSHKVGTPCRLAAQDTGSSCQRQIELRVFPSFLCTGPQSFQSRSISCFLSYCIVPLASECVLTAIAAALAQGAS